jgi:signal transduction histidine kinase
LRESLRAAARSSPLAVSVRAAGIGRFREEIEVAVYFCCLEALQNVVKHAGDDAVASLRLWRDRRAVRFSITDNGVGFVPRPGTQGAGLTNMVDRMGAVGGTLTVRSSPEEGTTILGGVAIEASERSSDVVRI